MSCHIVEQLFELKGSHLDRFYDLRVGLEGTSIWTFFIPD